MTVLTPRVMISGLTRKIATPIPLTTPIPSPAASATAIAAAAPWFAKLEIMKAPVVAVVATERSTPPVSITSVWPAAIRPRIAAYRKVVDSCFGVRNASPDWTRLTRSVATNSPTKTSVRTTTGLSAKSRRRSRLREGGCTACGAEVMDASPARGAPGRRS